MKNITLSIIALTLILIISCKNESITGDSSTKITELTDENYALAETQVIFSEYKALIASVTNTNGVGVLFHNKKPLDPNDRTVVRINFDTQYSIAILDLTEEATLTMPETDGRYQSAWFITEEHYNPLAINESGEFKINQENMGSKYVMVVVRTQVNMRDSVDLKIVSNLMDEIQLTQNNRGNYTPSNQWDMDEILAMRTKYQSIVVEKGITPDLMFGKKGELTLENHNCGTAFGWGGLTVDQAVYLPYIPTNTNPATLTLNNVPVHAFWSITVYDQDGFPVGDAYNINSSFAKKMDNDSVVIHFGGDTNSDNYLDIYPGWNFLVRLYQPTENYFNGAWEKPELTPIN